MTKQELLAVLDMSKDEQDYWTVENTNRGIRGGNYESLADLAFRLRDEFLKEGNHHHWELALGQVWLEEQKINGISGDVNQWANKYAKPIHWIIASLIAKGKTK